MNISIVTPWTDHLELADDYFDAVLPEMQPGDENIIVDDGSNPPLEFAMFRGHKLGFVGGSNLGLFEAEADAVLFLNNDISLGQRGWLQVIRDALEPGVLVGRLRYDRHAWVDSTPMPYLDGWCLAGMREDFIALDGFDDFLEEPAYYSDNLLCLEARAQGLTLREVTVGLHHKESATSRPSVNPEVRRVTLANQARYQARAREVLAAA